MDTWQLVIDSYTVYARAQRHSKRTIEGRQQSIRATARAIGKPLSEITYHDLLARLGRGIEPSSMQRERSDLQCFFRWAKEDGWIEEDPSIRLPPIIVPKRRPRPFTVEQVELLLSSGAYRRTRTMMMLGYYQGLRAHEIAKFQGTDIDPFSNRLSVIGKGGKHAVLPLHPEIKDQARLYGPGFWFPARKTNTTGHIHYRSVSDLMTVAIRRAGITDPDLTGHSFRHTYGTELVKAGVDLKTVQELMRHESLSSTEIYVKIAEEQLRSGLAQLPRVHAPEQSGRMAA